MVVAALLAVTHLIFFKPSITSERLLNEQQVRHAHLSQF